MPQHSILFPFPPFPRGKKCPPDFFKDLNLDQMVTAITETKESYALDSLFFSPLDDMETILYRQRVVQDLEKDLLRDQAETFSQKICALHRRIAPFIDFEEQTFQKTGYLEKGSFLEAAQTYCETLENFQRTLEETPLGSEGLTALRDYLQRYCTAPSFSSLKKDTLKVREEIQSIRYCMLIRGCSIRIKKYEGEKNYSEDILKTFEKFNEGPSTGNFRDIPKEQYASHIEEGILSILSRLFPEPFDALDRYCTHHACFFDATILHFAMDVQFYISFLNYLAPLREKKLPFCYPEITTESKEIHASGFFDIVLAQKLTEEGKSVVLNDFYLSSQERSMVISGPNQGGKTTFARSFAQIHYLASLGLPVPGRQARLFLPDRIFTHFEREEKVENFSGKLQEELIRMQQIFEKATDRSIIIINEIFSFTSLADALVIGKRIMRRITNLGCLCVCVTFLEELSRLNDTTVSMVSTVNPEKPEERTFTIIRKTADGLAYAISIARKHELTYEQIRKRLHQ